MKQLLILILFLFTISQSIQAQLKSFTYTLTWSDVNNNNDEIEIPANGSLSVYVTATLKRAHSTTPDYYLELRKKNANNLGSLFVSNIGTYQASSWTCPENPKDTSTCTLSITNQAVVLNAFTFNPIDDKLFIRSGSGNTVTDGSKEYKVKVKYPEISNNNIGANQTITIGEIPAKLTGSVPSGGSGIISYQWQSSSDGSTNWSNVSGATSQDLQLGALNATRFFRRLANSQYVVQNISNSVKITANSNNVISPSNQLVQNNLYPSPITGNTPSNFSGVSYQWEIKYAYGPYITWSPISGAMSKDYQPSMRIVPEVNEYQYRRKVTINGISTFSNIVNITFTDNGISPSGQTSCTPVLLTGSTPPNSGVSYQWEIKYAYGPYISWTPISGATNKDYQPSPTRLVNEVSEYQFRRKVTINGLGSSYSNIAIITHLNFSNNIITKVDEILPPFPVPYTQSISGSTPTCGTGNYMYQWEKKVYLAYPHSYYWENVNNATSKDYTSYPQEGRTYRRKVTSGNEVIYSNEVTTLGTLIKQGRLAAVEESSKEGVIIYPNPCKSKLHLSEFDVKITKVNIYNGIGNLMLTHSADSNEIDIPSSFPDGIYLVSIIFENGAVLNKSIKIED